MSSSKPLRLAYLVSQYPTVTHTFVLREIRALRAKGAEISVVSIRPADRPMDKLSVDERDELSRTFTVVTAGVWNILAAHAATAARHPLRYLAGLGYALRLAGVDLRKAVANTLYFGEAVVAGRYIQKLGLEHLHTHFSSTVAMFLARVFPVTYSATMHGPDEFRDPVGTYLAEKLAQARFICAISEFSRAQVLNASGQQYADKVEVAPLGVDTEVLQPIEAHQIRRRAEILCVGRLAPVKAHDVLLPAVERVLRTGLEARLRIVGDGPTRPRLETWVGEHNLRSNVTFEGACPQERVRAFYAEADLFVLASFAEGVPVVLMEAMAMGVPCVATRVAGVPELIRDGEDGLLVPPGDEAALAEAMERLLSDDALRGRVTASARARVVEKYNLAKNTDALYSLFRRRLAGSSEVS